MTTDWTKLRAEFIHGTMTMRELAKTHGINSSGVMRRAANEGWDAARKQESAKVSKAANQALGDYRASELSKFNDDDLKVARAIRAKAANMINGDLSPKDLKALAGAFDTAQKIGRLALGAATENTSLSAQGFESEYLNELTAQFIRKK